MVTGANDRLVYLGLKDGRAYTFDADDGRLARLPAAPGMPSDSFWNAAAMDDGRILFSTYPSARLLAYDPATRKWKDFGSFGGKNHYTMGVSTDGDMAFVGTGTNDPALWQVDTIAGTKQRIPLPPSVSDVARDFVYDTAVVGSTVFARVDSEDTVYAYDLKLHQWGKQIRGAARGLATSPPDSPDRLYWTDTDGVLNQLDVSTGKSRQLNGGQSFGALRGAAWQDTDGDGFKESLITVNSRGDVLQWNSTTDARTIVRAEGEAAPTLIRSLGTDSRGNILVGGFGSAPYFARLPYKGGAVQTQSLSGQVESFGSVGGQLVVGTYPQAAIHVVPESLDGDFEPEARWHLAHGQDRPMDIEALSGTRFAVASLPVYGKTGGAVSFIRTDGGVERVLDNVAPGRSPLVLEAFRGRVFVGTGSSGGLGAKLDDGDGTVVELNAVSGERLKTVVPVPGDATISALVVDAKGRLWGWSVDSIFELDPETLKTIRKKRYSMAKDDEPYARGRSLVDLGTRLAGSARGKIFVVDKKSLHRKTLAEGSNLVRGGDGELYYSRGSTVYRWSFGKVATG